MRAAIAATLAHLRARWHETGEMRRRRAEVQRVGTEKVPRGAVFTANLWLMAHQDPHPLKVVLGSGAA